MRLVNPVLQGALEVWRGLPPVDERACADNIHFEERVSAARLRSLEHHLAGIADADADADADALRRGQVDYCKTHVEVGEGLTPHTFDPVQAPADLGMLDETRWLVRLESLARPLKLQAMDADDLMRAYTAGDTATLDGFVSKWNEERDYRPAFATFEDQLPRELAATDWPERLRDRMGLAHHTCAAGPIPVALMRYRFPEVTRAARAGGATCMVTVPTVLDQGPNPQFFPAPTALPCGRCMPLGGDYDETDLVAEVLHWRIPYHRRHIAKLGMIARAPAPYDLRELRNHHLLVLRLAANAEHFGAEMAA